MVIILCSRPAMLEVVMFLCVSFILILAYYILGEDFSIQIDGVKYTFPTGGRAPPEAIASHCYKTCIIHFIFGCIQ